MASYQEIASRVEPSPYPKTKPVRARRAIVALTDVRADRRYRIEQLPRDFMIESAPNAGWKVGSRVIEQNQCLSIHEQFPYLVARD